MSCRRDGKKMRKLLKDFIMIMLLAMAIAMMISFLTNREGYNALVEMRAEKNIEKMLSK